MPLKTTSTPYLQIPKLQPIKMTDVQTSEVDTKLAPDNVDNKTLYADRS
jgi:hypothetical protein